MATFPTNTAREMWHNYVPNNLVYTPAQPILPSSREAMTRGWVLPPAQVRQAPIIPNVQWTYNTLAGQFWDNKDILNQLTNQYNWYSAFDTAAKNIGWLYGAFYKTTDPYYENFNRINQWIDQDVVGKLKDQLNTAYSQYWPQGDQTKRVASYYDNMLKNVAAQNAVNLGTIAAQSAASWANTWAQRAATSRANLDANTQFMQLKQKEIENYDNIYKNLNSYIDNFVNKYTGSKDKYVRDTYNQLLNYKTQLQQAYLNSLQQVEQARLKNALR